MIHADFMHLVRLGEQECQDDPIGYQRRLQQFARLAYVWVAGWVLLGLAAALVAAWWLMGGHRLSFGLVLALIGVLSCWTGAQAAWLHFDFPRGIRVSPAAAPALFEALEKVRQSFNGPTMQTVLLTAQFEIRIVERPRHGLFGAAEHCICIGLPLLLAVDRARWLSLLAHEYARQRQADNTVSVRLCRARSTWVSMYHHLSQNRRLWAWPSNRFFLWFFPRYSAHSFALARMEDYRCDALAAQLVGAPVLASAMTESQIKQVWMKNAFWPMHWRRALASPDPMAPLAELQRLLALPPDTGYAQQALREVMRGHNDGIDTLPVLRDRLNALKQPTQLPSWSTKPALSLLGGNAKVWFNQADEVWVQTHAREWKQHHLYLNRQHARLKALLASRRRNGADEMVELADLQQRLEPGISVRSFYERALEVTPGHGAALRGLIQCLSSSEHERAMALLDELFENSVGNRLWTCQHAMTLLSARTTPDAQQADQVTLWRSRLRQAEDAEHRASLEHSNSPVLSSISRNDLSDFEKGEFLAKLGQVRAVRRAWLVNKNLKEFPQRRCYNLFLELPGLDDESRHHLCRELEHQLPLPGSVLIGWVDQTPSLRDIERHGLHPTFVRSAK